LPAVVIIGSGVVALGTHNTHITRAERTKKKGLHRCRPDM
jgi:hypothetical protein